MPLYPPAGSGGGAPTDADYLVGTANGGLSAEIVVGTSPGGELGNTWASPTVDATHSGSSHAGIVGAYRTHFRSTARFSTAAVAGTKYFIEPTVSDTSSLGLGGSANNQVWAFYLDDADYTISGFTTKLRIRVMLWTPTTLTMNVSPGLYPLTLAAGNVTLGTLIAGTDQTIVNATANVINLATTADFDMPADGPYALGLIVSNTVSTPFSLHAELQMRWV